MAPIDRGGGVQCARRGARLLRVSGRWRERDELPSSPPSTTLLLSFGRIIICRLMRFGFALATGPPRFTGSATALGASAPEDGGAREAPCSEPALGRRLDRHGQCLA